MNAQIRVREIALKLDFVTSEEFDVAIHPEDMTRS